MGRILEYGGSALIKQIIPYEPKVKRIDPMQLSISVVEVLLTLFVEYGTFIIWCSGFLGYGRRPSEEGETLVNGGPAVVDEFYGFNVLVEVDDLEGVEFRLVWGQFKGSRWFWTVIGVVEWYQFIVIERRL
ncbi:hypothetical protein F3Y22_tig00110450pilonHSYRG00166 [Hibiscus syriacus]|uniref:Uncharacterized protein n=1 Tax=Hibiscus syriacus TaxID=106335 RepID=A0A6A3AIS9_HIBSY|nr:hypothetical protein F3Y22_tig00110450pilonHSYRG00166 [Hibiscus syriacus]